MGSQARRTWYEAVGRLGLPPDTTPLSAEEAWEEFRDAPFQSPPDTSDAAGRWQPGAAGGGEVGAPPAPSRRARLLRLVLAGAAVAAGTLVLAWLASRDPEPARETRVAVLSDPLEDHRFPELMPEEQRRRGYEHLSRSAPRDPAPSVAPSPEGASLEALVSGLQQARERLAGSQEETRLVLESVLYAYPALAGEMEPSRELPPLLWDASVLAEDLELWELARRLWEAHDAAACAAANPRVDLILYGRRRLIELALRRRDLQAAADASADVLDWYENWTLKETIDSGWMRERVRHAFLLGRLGRVPEAIQELDEVLQLEAEVHELHEEVLADLPDGARGPEDRAPVSSGQQPDLEESELRLRALELARADRRALRP